MNLSTRLYKAQHIVHDEDLDEYGFEAWDSRSDLDFPEPAGWRDYAIEKWGRGEGDESGAWPNGYKPFFFPTDRTIYRSRSSAQARVDLINRWGGDAVLVEAEVEWLPVTVANERRAQSRKQARIARLEAEIAALRGEPNA